MKLVRVEKASKDVLVQGLLPCHWANRLQQEIAKFSVQVQGGQQLLSPVVLHLENQIGQGVRLQVLQDKPAHPELACVR